MTAAGTELTAIAVAAFDEAAGQDDSKGPQSAGPIAARLVKLARLVEPAWLVGLQPGWRVLDAGCGTRAALARAARAVSPGGEVTGVDLAPGTLARAAREFDGRLQFPIRMAFLAARRAEGG